MVDTAKVAKARELIARCEADLGHKLDNHLIDLLCDNDIDDTLEECRDIIRVIRPEYGR